MLTALLVLASHEAQQIAQCTPAGYHVDVVEDGRGGGQAGGDRWSKGVIRKFSCILVSIIAAAVLSKLDVVSRGGPSWRPA